MTSDDSHFDGDPAALGTDTEKEVETDDPDTLHDQMKEKLPELGDLRDGRIEVEL